MGAGLRGLVWVELCGAAWNEKWQHEPARIERANNKNAKHRTAKHSFNLFINQVVSVLGMKAVKISSLWMILTTPAFCVATLSKQLF